MIFIVNDSFSDDKKFVPIKKFEVQFQFSRFFPFRKRDFYASDSSDETVIQKFSDKEIDGDENPNIEKSIEEGIEKSIKEDIKKVVE
jgi:hypothetical protein